MQDFVLLIRHPDGPPPSLPEPEQKAALKKWEDWFAGIAAQGRLKSMGSRLNPKGKVLRGGGVITDGPFVELREQLSGFIVVLADTIEDAITLAHGCPVLNIGGSVEIRQEFNTPVIQNAG